MYFLSHLQLLPGDGDVMLAASVENGACPKGYLLHVLRPY